MQFEYTPKVEPFIIKGDLVCSKLDSDMLRLILCTQFGEVHVAELDGTIVANYDSVTSLNNHGTYRLVQRNGNLKLSVTQDVGRC